jgi:hypothetical protein
LDNKRLSEELTRHVEQVKSICEKKRKEIIETLDSNNLERPLLEIITKLASSNVLRNREVLNLAGATGTFINDVEASLRYIQELIKEMEINK